MKASEVETPELEKMSAVKNESQKIGEFLDWLESKKKVALCLRHTHDDGCYLGHDDDGNEQMEPLPLCGYENGSLMPFFYTINELLAEFFEIDLKKVEEERRALLDAIREENLQRESVPA